MEIQDKGVNRIQAGSKPATDRFVIQIGVILLVTVAAWEWAQLSRHLSGGAPFVWKDIPNFDIIHPVGLAVSIQALFAPFLLIYLFSRTVLFRKIVNGESDSRSTMRLVGSLTLLQIIAFGYSMWFVVHPLDQATFGFLIVIVAGLLGGWRVGMWVGLLSMLAASTNWYILDTHGRTFLALFAQNQGSQNTTLTRLWFEFYVYYLANLRSIMALWAGVVAGLCGSMLGERRFSPAAAFGLGAGIQAIAIFFVGITVERPFDYFSMAPSSILIMGLALAVIMLIVRDVQAEGVRRKIEQAELARVRAELRALRAQINPHFLFNSLNTIRYCVRTNPKVARALLLDLSEVFQRALRAGEFSPLRDEISYLQAYLSLEKARLGDRLQVEWGGSLNADDPLRNESSMLDIPVPTLILQPIVENAVIHGIGRKPDGGKITIVVTSTRNDLLVKVEDSGAGIAPSRLAEIFHPTQSVDMGIGLHNVDSRLRAHYGEDYRVTIDSKIGQGTCVLLKVPIKGGTYEHSHR